MVERRTPNPNAGGSSPSWPAILTNGQFNYDGVAMAGKGKDKKSVAEVKSQPSPYSPKEIKKFVGEVQSEFSKIVWPDKKVTLGLTGMVVLLALVISAYLGTVDVILGKLISAILH